MKTLCTWADILAQEQQKPYFQEVIAFTHLERKSGKIIYPAEGNVFNAFNLTPFADVRVIMLGQDPYHAVNQAQGLSFSVPLGVPVPPSLKNIYKELHNDLGIEIPNHGHLESWARQGVFLLNAVLTVEAGQPGSHAGRGWEQFTDAVIKILSDERDHLVFLLWGKYAQQKQNLIDTTKHTVLTAAHPSPFSAYKGFFGCKHFSQTNTALQTYGYEPINWQIPK